MVHLESGSLWKGQRVSPAPPQIPKPAGLLRHPQNGVAERAFATFPDGPLGCRRGF
jgi:hypothetical protein